MYYTTEVQTFNEYMIDWWHNFLANDHSSCELAKAISGDIEDLDDDDEAYDYLYNLYDNGSDIYKLFFGYKPELDACEWSDAIPSTQELLASLFMQAVYNRDLSYVQEFCEDMAIHAQDYVTPEGFFKDLAYGGCQSGMIGMLIYNSDCKKIYIENIDDMEDTKAALEDEMGEPIRNTDKLPHYTFLCWLCYEELAHQIEIIFEN